MDAHNVPGWSKGLIPPADTKLYIAARQRSGFPGDPCKQTNPPQSVQFPPVADSGAPSAL